MHDAGREASFTLTYDTARSDLEHIYATDPRQKRRRKNTLAMAVPFLLSALALTAIAVAVSHPAAKNSGGATDLLYALVGLSWLMTILLGGGAIWLMSPRVLARSTWRNHPRLHGRHQDTVGPAGVTSVSPDGSEAFSPWKAITSVLETDDAFFLLAQDGSARQVLLKRGLPSPDLIPALREFLSHSVGRSPPAAADAAAGDPTP